MFEGGTIGIIVGGVAIDEAIKEEGVEWEAPVVRRGIVVMVSPLT